MAKKHRNRQINNPTPATDLVEEPTIEEAEVVEEVAVEAVPEPVPAPAPVVVTPTPAPAPKPVQPVAAPVVQKPIKVIPTIF